MRAHLVAALAAAAKLIATAAAACPGVDAPCEVEGGYYRALAPEGAPRGLALFLHGWGGRADAALGQPYTADLLRRGYVVAAPQGEPRRPGDAGGSWNSALREGRRDDVAFLRRVIADARARFGPLPVLAGGFSGGGMMVWRLACDAPDSADAYAPISGLMWRPLPAGCVGPAPLLHTQGWSDEVVPIEGRSVGGGALMQGDLFEGMALMRRTNRCADDAPDRYGATDGMLTREWSDCAAPLALALHPGGHVAPAGWADMAVDWFEGARRD
jgi:polyhydroxybutyrate depolymerase